MLQYRKDPEANRLVDDYIAKHDYYIFKISGLYPRMDNKNGILSIIQLMLYVLTLIYHMIIVLKTTISMSGSDMVLISQNIHFCLLMQVAVVGLLNITSKNSSMLEIYKLMACDFYDYKEPAAIGEELLRSNMRTERRRLILIPIGAVLAAGVVLTVSPIVDFKAGSFDFNGTSSMFDYQLPHPYTKNPFHVEDGFGYWFAVTGQVATGMVLSAIIGGGGYFFIQISESVSLQMMILNNSLDNIESRIEHMYSKLFGKMDENYMESLLQDSRYTYCYTKCLRKNFEHHQVILKAFYLLEDIYSLTIGGSYLTGTIVIALSLISAGSAKELPGTTVASMLLCAVEVGYMFLFSVMGQRFTDLSTELRSKIYNTRWYMCSKEIKSTLMIFQEKTLKPITMKAAKTVPANMETFTTVMNAAYSYYNLVHAFDKK